MSAAPGRHDPSGTIKSKVVAPAEEPAAGIPAQRKLKAVFYVDGFNLYHALDALKQNHLKWLNLWALAEKLIDHNTEYLGGVYWCTARDGEGGADKYQRHFDYQKALESVGVQPLLGHFADSPIKCAKCGREYSKRTEKASDVNVGIHAVADAVNGQVESVYLVTADTDQAATAKFLHEVCPEVRLTIVAPPGMTHSQHLLNFANGSRTIREETLLDCLFAKNVTKAGKHVVDRPHKYDLPAGFLKEKAKAAAAVKAPVTVVIKKRRELKKPTET